MNCPKCNNKMSVSSLIAYHDPWLYYHPFCRPLTDTSQHWHHIKPSAEVIIYRCSCRKWNRKIKKITQTSMCWCGSLEYIGELKYNYEDTNDHSK